MFLIQKGSICKIFKIIFVTIAGISQEMVRFSEIKKLYLKTKYNKYIDN